MKLFRNTKGFGAIETILILVIVGLIGGVGFYVWQVNNKDKTELKNSGVTNQTNKASVQPETPKKTFTHDEARFSLDYPQDWSEATEIRHDYGDGKHATSTDLTSPKGTVVSVYVDLGGYGGYCDPEPTDKPHAKGNYCSTLETLSVDLLSTKIKTFLNHPETPVKLITQRHTERISGESTYIIGLDADYPDSSVTVHEPLMGGFNLAPVGMDLYFGEDIDDWRNVSICALSKDSAFLASEEGKVVKTILMSFKKI